jgi:hypothetical protein
MNSITHTISGLASSLFLNVGLTQVAQKLDPVSSKNIPTATDVLSAEICAVPCAFTQEKGL